ncbi:MAG: DUF3108 domain-containing protein [Bacteroidota bacterium]
MINIRRLLVLGWIVFIWMGIGEHGWAQKNPQTVLELGPYQPPTMEELLNSQEYFEYEVRYGFIKLGNIEVEILGDSLYRGKRTYHLRTIIRSAPGLPFVGEEENQYHSLMAVRDSIPYTMVFWTDNVDENIYEETRYEFYHDRGVVHTFEEGEPVDTLDIQQPASSGHIVFYLSRLFAGSTTPYNIPVYINHEEGWLKSKGDLSIDKREYRAFSSPIPTYRMDGKADVRGPFGFSGRFTSFFAADRLRVPLEAHVKVWIGWVKVRLSKYELKSEISQSQ